MIVSTGLKPPLGDMQAAVSDEDVRNVVKLAVFVRHGGLRIVAHAARASLMLSAADTETGDAGPSLNRAGFLQPLLGLRPT